MARSRREGPLSLDAHRRFRPHPALDRLSGLGLGHRRWRPSPVIPQKVRLGDGAQRSYPPGDAKSRRQRHLPHRALDGFSAAGARRRCLARTDEGRRRPAAHHARHRQHHLQAERAAARHHRHAAQGLRRAKMMRSALVAAVLGAVVGSGLAGGVLVARAASPATAVSIDNFTFTPQTLTVKAGTTVTWTNKDDIPHGIAATNNAFKRSLALDTDDSFSFTFTAPGTYQYFCYVHPHMTGTIVVEAATGNNASN